MYNLKYDKWFKENKNELTQCFAKEYNIQPDEVEDWYLVEFHKYCKRWYKDEIF